MSPSEGRNFRGLGSGSRARGAKPGALGIVRHALHVRDVRSVGRREITRLGSHKPHISGSENTRYRNLFERQDVGLGYAIQT